MYEKIKKWHSQGLWTTEMVKCAVDKGILTREQFCEITGEDYVN